jgi:hypothetical protein
VEQSIQIALLLAAGLELLAPLKRFKQALEAVEDGGRSAAPED